VQTESKQGGESVVDRNESRCSKFAISRSKECQIQVICSVRKEEVANLPKPVAKEEVKESQPVPTYAVNVNLKASPVDSEPSVIKYSQQEIEFTEKEQITTPRLGPELIKSADDVASLIKASKDESFVKKDRDTKTQIEKV
jgi:hypothetical protein